MPAEVKFGLAATSQIKNTSSGVVGTDEVPSGGVTECRTAGFVPKQSEPGEV